MYKIYEKIRLRNRVFNRQQNALTKTGRKLALVQILMMIAAVLFCTAVVYLFWGGEYAKSAFVGGCVAVIPNCVFAYKAFQFAGARASQQVMKSFYGGAKLKLGLTAVLFALAFKLIVILPAPFFGVYCLAVLTALLTPMFLKY